MSRTIRRKNAWNAHHYVCSNVENARDDWYIRLLRGDTNVQGHNAGKYRGCTNEQIIEKLNAKYHSDNWGDWKVHRDFKKALKKRQRAVNETELIKYLKEDLEDDYHLSTKRECRGELIWYFY
jgi:hypothetical protein